MGAVSSGSNAVEVSVIVPMRNAEKYIGRCAVSLFEQTMGDDVEFIFVDDCSTDATVERLTEALMRYPGRFGRYRLLHHRECRGQAAARNTGLTCAVGRYVAFCDADDWVETDIYRRLLDEARASGADLVFCDFFKEYVGRRRRVKCRAEADARRSLDRLLANEMLPSVWNVLIRRRLFTDHQIRFPEGVEKWEDFFVMAMLLYRAGGCTRLPLAMYHFNVTNPDAVSVLTQCRVSASMSDVIDRLERFWMERGEDRLVRRLDYKKLSVRLEYLLHSRQEAPYPEADRSIWSYRALSPFWRLALKAYSRHGSRMFSLWRSAAGGMRK